MNEITILNQRGKAVVSSRIVAEDFGKLHKDVLESIRGIGNQISTAEFSALFIKSTYVASNGKSNPEYLMNRDGFSLLVMGFTGREALNFKLRYIEAFNKMETQIIEWNYARNLIRSETRSLTDLVKEVEEPSDGRIYGEYHNMIYKAALGKNSYQLKKGRGIKGNLRDNLSTEELKCCDQVSNSIKELLSFGFERDEIKIRLKRKYGGSFNLSRKS